MNSEMYSSFLLALCYSSMFLRIRLPSLLISFLMFMSSLFSGSLFSYSLMLFWVYLLPPSMYDIEQSRMELARLMLLQMLPLISEVIKEPMPQSFKLSCSLLMSYEECSQSSAYHSSIYLGSGADSGSASGYLTGSTACSPMCYYFGYYLGYSAYFLIVLISPLPAYFFLFAS